MPPSKKKQLSPSPPQIGDNLRAVARMVLQQTELLEKAIKKGDILAARSALEAGALPEHALFRDRKGHPTSSAVALAMNHEDPGIARLLVDFGAPLNLSAVGNVWRAALEKDRTELFPLLLSKVKPRAQEWEIALSRPLMTFKALDDLLPLDRTQNVGRLKKTGHPPLFLVVEPKLLDYLLDTGAIATQVPLPTPVEVSGPDSWYNRTSINHLIRRSSNWSTHTQRYEKFTLDLVVRLYEAGVELSEDDFLQAFNLTNKGLIFFFMDHGFRIKSGIEDVSGKYAAAMYKLNYFAGLAEDVIGYQTSLDDAVVLVENTDKTGTFSTSRRL